MSEHRLVHGGVVRAAVATDGAHTVVARVVSYGTVDSYGTIFDAGCFAESLRTKMPVFAWAHSWAEPIGRATKVIRDDDTALALQFRLDDFDAVPRAGQAYAQLQSGTLTDFSVGFQREAAFEDDEGVLHFTRARLDEVSIVLAGAVPGTELLSVRSRRGAPDDWRGRLRRDLRAGRITRRQYQRDIELYGDADELLERMGL